MPNAINDSAFYVFHRVCSRFSGSESFSKQKVNGFSLLAHIFSVHCVEISFLKNGISSGLEDESETQGTHIYVYDRQTFHNNCALCLWEQPKMSAWIYLCYIIYDINLQFQAQHGCFLYDCMDYILHCLMVTKQRRSPVFSSLHKNRFIIP